MITNNPSEANAFIVYHNWITGGFRHCGEFLDGHLQPIVNNVVDNFAYYNLSNGLNHYFFAVYDRGVYDNRTECWTGSDEYLNKLRKTLSQISNASFIGNYGMDLQTFGTFHTKRNNKLKIQMKYVLNLTHSENLQFIPERDIVIPQMLTPEILTKYHNNLKNPIHFLQNRKFDSTFSGSAWWDRQPLVEMAFTMEEDYKNLKTENLKTYFRRAADMSLISNAYFGYNPCGFACWSTRLFDGIASQNIPIVIGTGNIQAFEKFINWKAFSVKISREHWFNVTARNEFRLYIRFECDNFRMKLNKHSEISQRYSEYQNSKNNNFTIPGH